MREVETVQPLAPLPNVGRTTDHTRRFNTVHRLFHPGPVTARDSGCSATRAIGDRSQWSAQCGFSVAMRSRLSSDQVRNISNGTAALVPMSVSSYSTRGGTSG